MILKSFSLHIDKKKWIVRYQWRVWWERSTVDIYSLNEKETDAVKLDASTIKQLYEDTGYKLDDVRKNKLVSQ